MTEPIRTMADGTIKQLNPLSGTQVWTVPGRGNRPLGGGATSSEPLDTSNDGHYCAFCEKRYLETPPEKSRVVSATEGFTQLTRVRAEELFDTVAEFRRIPNLFEILSLDYWQDNYGYRLPPETREWMADYMSSPDGEAHVLGIARTKALASGVTAEQWDSFPERYHLDWSENFFAGGHDVIVARRHYIDGATRQDQLAGSGTLSVAEHREFIAFTVEALQSLHAFNPDVKYVTAFQNWLRPAGASFDHLHKQLVAIDEHGANAEREYERVRKNPNIYNEMAVGYAAKAGLIVAHNDHAIAFAGFGHRYPTLEIFSTSAAHMPWDHSEEEVQAMSDLIHACHAAVGVTVPCNEEWYYQPRDIDVSMPWRVLIKWRISTLAGFEGGTKINVNTISPYGVRDRVMPTLRVLRDAGAIAPIRLGTECQVGPNPLKYN